MKPTIIKGSSSSDSRGKVIHNNNFNLHLIKRIYIIENSMKNKVRGWKGHKIEKRWFFCSKGEVEVSVVNLECFGNENPFFYKFKLNDTNLDVLYVPQGYATSIKQIKPKSKIVAMSDYLINTSNDENLRWDKNFFNR